MPAITVRVRNMSRLQAKIKKLPWDIQAGAITGLRKLAQPIEDDIKRDIRSGEKTGRLVRRSHPARLRRASAPGESPADDRGELANSIEVDVDPREFNLTLSALAAHARPLELGARHMLPRPFLVPALDRWRRRVIEALHDAIKRKL